MKSSTSATKALNILFAALLVIGLCPIQHSYADTEASATDGIEEEGGG